MYKKFYKGMIEVITGPMFSGKSDELLKRIRILKYANIETLVIKHKFDKRFSDEEIISRTGAKVKAKSASNIEEIKKLFNPRIHQAIAIDEAQFFQKDLVNFINEKADQGIRIIVSGLDMDYLRRPFGIMPQILAIAEHITKLQAICLQCKKAASTTFRKTKSNALKVLGDVDEYEARCRNCHIQKQK
ncbi:thymidine kinase [Mesomycoplasma neurolyticum]|uniref:Thymidine kinase n=1 Tax=Mesomycoplasma neurolyticum TaxID=2120 RepID=A0A449A644_9BACT|nr:thymidine kinase [Mesomycoplasma neurolyticum]VEU59697.1 thymidine kinase [Mesomycoplasma neurolyticum]